MPRIAILGVGHELRGDDAAGVSVARALLAHSEFRISKSEVRSPHFARLVIDAGTAPENHTSSLRRFGPDLVLLIDAAQMDEAPGAVRWLDWRDTSGLSASTHTLPPYVLAQYLTCELGCELALIGIQPADTRIDAPLSPAAQQAVATVMQALAEALPPQEAGKESL